MTAVHASRADLRRSASFFFLTPVWGAGHLDLFLTIGLPSLLAQRNLPAFRNLRESIFYIYTQISDKATLRAAAASGAWRSIWLRMGRPGAATTAAAPSGVEVRWLPLKAAALVTLPVVYVASAAAGAGLNAAGLAVDWMRAARDAGRLPHGSQGSRPAPPTAAATTSHAPSERQG